MRRKTMTVQVRRKMILQSRLFKIYEYNLFKDYLLQEKYFKIEIKGILINTKFLNKKTALRQAQRLLNLV